MVLIVLLVFQIRRQSYELIFNYKTIGREFLTPFIYKGWGWCPWGRLDP